MGKLTGLDDVINRATGGSSGSPEFQHIYKTMAISAVTPQAPIVQFLTSMWMYDGCPSGGSAPGGTARNPTRTTAGAIGQANAAAGKEKWLLGVLAALQNGATGILWLYDRLADISGLNATTTGVQTVTGLSVSRNTGTDGWNNHAFVEIYSQIGATNGGITANYLDENGTSATTELTDFGATNFREVNRLLRLPMSPSAGRGVTAITGYTLGGTTGTAGDFGFTIGRPLLCFSSEYAGAPGVRDLVVRHCGPVKCYDDAALWWVFQAGATAVPELDAQLNFIEA